MDTNKRNSKFRVNIGRFVIKKQVSANLLLSEEEMQSKNMYALNVKISIIDYCERYG